MDFDQYTKGFFIVWVIAALTGLGLTGVIIWAIVRLVSKFL